MKSLRNTLSLLTVCGLIGSNLDHLALRTGAIPVPTAPCSTFVTKDVTADILPPPMYLIELRLVLSQGVKGTLRWRRFRAEAARI